MKDGWCTILFYIFQVKKVQTMTMKGGNTDEVYAESNNRKEFAESLKEQHPECVEVVWRYGRWHHQVDYSWFIKRNKLRIKDDYIKKQGINNYGMVLRNVEAA